MAKRPFRVGEWLVEPAIDEISRSAERIKVEPRTMAVLVLLAERAPDVLSQEEIERTVWSGTVVTPHSVYQSVAQLRRLLGDEPKNPRYIATVPRKGYRLVARVEPVTPGVDGTARAGAAESPSTLGSGPPTASDIGSPAAAPRSPGARAARRRHLWLAATLAVTIAAALAALRIAGVWPFAALAGQGAENSIAVLPLQDVSPEGKAGPIVDGIASELVNALSQAPELRVAGTTSSFSLRNDPRPLPELGRLLGVKYLVEGTVSRVGERVRVSVRLLDAAQGFRVWSETYDRPFAEILQVQDDIARSVAGALKVLLIRRPGIGLSERRPRSLTAYELYLIGTQSFMARTPQALAESADYFRRAIDEDAEFAAAYTGLADTYIAEYFYANRPLTEAEALARPLIDKALTLDPGLATAYGLSALLAFEAGQLERAEKDAMRAIELNNNYSRSHLWLGMIRHEQLRLEEALTSFNRAIELDPLIFAFYIWRGLTFDSLGRSALGQQDMERAIMVAPRHPNPHYSMGLNAVARGEMREAARHYAHAAELDTRRGELRHNLALIELDLDQGEAARKHFNEAATIARSGRLHLNALAWLAFADGDQERLAVLGRDLKDVAGGDPFVLTEAAFFLGLAGRAAEAVEVYDGILAAENGENAIYPIWPLRWGMEFHGLHYAAYLRVANQRDRADRALLDLEAYLDRAERGGFRHWGIVYVRAGIAAQRGETDIALQLLEQARALGWRRPFWSQRDPALAPLRDNPAFRELLARARPG